jgi:hypothetical protein
MRTHPNALAAAQITSTATSRLKALDAMAAVGGAGGGVHALAETLEIG